MQIQQFCCFCKKQLVIYKGLNYLLQALNQKLKQKKEYQNNNNSMSYSPDKELANLQNQLNHSVEEEYPHNNQRSSDMQKMQFDHQNHHDHEPHFQQVQHSTNFMRDSQFEQEGVFSYDDDTRLRQSVKSQEDFQLEDVSGNADMTDRRVSQNKQNLQTIKIVPSYQQKTQQISTQPAKNQQTQLKQNDDKQKQQLQPKDLEQTSQKVSIVQQALEQKQKLPQSSTSQQLTSTSPIAELISQAKPSTPMKQQTQLNVASNEKQSWSSKSNKSYSPMPEQDIYQSPKKQKQQQKQPEPLTTKISFVKQNITTVQQTQLQKSAVSSIRDWFRAPVAKPSPMAFPKQDTPKKQPLQQQPIKQDAKLKYKKEMQAQMLGFQQNLSKHQKANKLFGTTDRQKEKHKINKTHLPQARNKKFMSETEQMNSEEYRMLLKISFEKKKQNYQTLKDWDKRRAQNMNVHRNMIELLQNEIDKRIKSSLQNFEIYTNFFKQKLRQEQKFVNSPVINTKYALLNNTISKNIYINCSVILNSLSEENQHKCKKIQDFITLIRNSILKDLTDQHLHQSQRELLKVREKISTLKNSLKKYNTETQQKSQTLAGYFSQSASNVSIKSQNDFYAIQLDFLRCAGQQILIQKRLGQNCLEYYHTALNQEFKRAKVIKQALLTYSKGLKETYNIQLQDVELEQLSKSQQDKLIEEFYSLQDMFDERNSLLLKNKFKIPDQRDINIGDVTKYVESFEFENFSSRMLLLKEFQAKYFTTSNGTSKDSKSARQQTCYMAITVDFHIHLFFSSQKTSLNFKPDVSFKIMAKQLQIREQKQQFVEIVKKQQKRGSMISYFWDSKNQKSYRVKFASKDAKQQFCDYVRKLMY